MRLSASCLPFILLAALLAPVVPAFTEELPIRTPPAAATPRLTGAAVVGASPGKPFLHCCTATGERPLRFAAKGLPDGLVLDAASGLITGAVASAGDYAVTVTATNALAAATRTMHIVIGVGKLALTPPMGWNSWNCFANAVTARNVSDAADQFVKAGLRDHGWQYINIDDFWMVRNEDQDPALHGQERDAQGRINSNARFPDMKGLADHIHGLGLKAGLYSSPGPRTCGGCVGSWEFERQDAERFAEWGFDYLKYDWCSYGQARVGHQGDNWPDEATRNGYALDFLKQPYTAMAAQLRAQPRDIVFSLCQYGMGQVWEWGRAVGGNCWRIRGDIRDNWDSISSIGFGQSAAQARCAGPGAWNDPDMLVVGWVGWGPNLHPSHLTADEQYTHITLWCLQSAPLLIGCDLTKLDAFTLGLLTNDEVLDVDQDARGEQAQRIAVAGDGQVWAKTMADGAKAVGLFNLSDHAQTVGVRWQDLGLSGPQRVRDLWLQSDLGEAPTGHSAVIAPHGCLLIRVAQPR